MKRNPLLGVVWGGLIAGILDIGFAAVSFVLQGKSIPLLLKSVAGGALGRGALQGGAGIAALGLLFHFVISFGAASVYFGVSRVAPWVNRHAWGAGLVYGFLVYLFMNMVVLPLSAYHKAVAFPPVFVPDVLSHLFFVGLVIALCVRRFSR